MTPDKQSGSANTILEIAGFLADDRETETRTCSSTKPRSLLKRTHSLDIPDLKNYTTPSITDFMLDSTTPAEILQNNNRVPEDIYSEWLDANTGADALDEIIPMSLCANFPEPETGLSESSSDSPSSDRSQGPKRHCSRKEEIQDLRKTAAELTQMVHVLMGIPSMKSSENGKIIQHVASRFAGPQTLWEHMAARQLKLRCKTEEENDMLKDLMSSQRRAARNIRRMIRRRADSELMEGLCNLKRPKLKNTEQVLGELLFGIDKIYVNLDKFYAEKGMNSVPCPGRKRRVYPDASRGSPFVEFSDKTLVPFSFDRAENAIWIFLRGPRSRGQVYVRSKEFQHATETSTCCVDIACTGRGLSTHVSEQHVARKIVQENSTVFISRTHVIPTVEKYFSSMRFNETLRIVVRSGIPLYSGQLTTIIESHYSVSRDTKGCDPSIERQWQSYLNLAVKGWERKVSFNNQEIENLLFKECLKSRDLEIS